MEVTALPHLQFSTQCHPPTRVADFLALTKPRVMLLAVLTALVGLMIAPGNVDPLLGSIAILAIAAGAGAAAALNMWCDADIDAVTRAAGRPILRDAVSRPEARALGLVLASASVAILGLALNATAAALLAFAIFFTPWCTRCG
jgi:protoheme IX farnesyltransferase